MSFNDESIDAQLSGFQINVHDCVLTVSLLRTATKVTPGKASIDDDEWVIDIQSLPLERDAHSISR
jgi:hypothetical protein